MSVEQMNKKLEKVLKDLDKAIEDRDIAKVEKAIQDAEELNKKSEGKSNEALIIDLEARIRQITEDIMSDETLDVAKRKELVEIRRKMRDGKNPFEKLEKVVGKLSQQTTNQEDLKDYKEQQKEDNTIKIDTIKENYQQLEKSMTDIEMRYLEPIENNNEIIVSMQNILKEYNFIKDDLDSSSDADLIASTKLKIKSMLSKLEEKGVDISSVDGFESDISKLESFKNEVTNLQNTNKDMIDNLKKDARIPDELKQQYDFANIKKVKELQNKFKEIAKEKQRYLSKIRTLQAENRQIDETIQTLKMEQYTRDRIYNEDGTKKTRFEIADMILESGYRDEIKKDVDDKFSEHKQNMKGWFKNIRARMHYYQEYNDEGGFKAFWHAVTHKNKHAKTLAVAAQAEKKGMDISDLAAYRMEERRKNFAMTMKREARKQMAQNPTLSENDIRVQVTEEAYKSALGEEGEGHDDR